MARTDFTKFPLLEYVVRHEQDLSAIRKLLRYVPATLLPVRIHNNDYTLADMPARAELIEPQTTIDFVHLLDSAGKDGSDFVDEITGPYARVVFSSGIISRTFHRHYKMDRLLLPNKSLMEGQTALKVYHHDQLNDAHLLWLAGKRDDKHVNYVHFVIE